MDNNNNFINILEIEVETSADEITDEIISKIDGPIFTDIEIIFEVLKKYKLFNENGLLVFECYKSRFNW